MATANHPAWRKHPGLAWSNRNAKDTIRILADLTRYGICLLYDLVLVFGLERLRREWELLKNHNSSEFRRAGPVLDRIFHHL